MTCKSVIQYSNNIEMLYVVDVDVWALLWYFFHSAHSVTASGRLLTVQNFSVIWRFTFDVKPTLYVFVFGSVCSDICVCFSFNLVVRMCLILQSICLLVSLWQRTIFRDWESVRSVNLRVNLLQHQATAFQALLWIWVHYCSESFLLLFANLLSDSQKDWHLTSSFLVIIQVDICNIMYIQ